MRQKSALLRLYALNVIRPFNGNPPSDHNIVLDNVAMLQQRIVFSSSASSVEYLLRGQPLTRKYNVVLQHAPLFSKHAQEPLLRKLHSLDIVGAPSNAMHR
jgi:hypothetical protein